MFFSCFIQHLSFKPHLFLHNVTVKEIGISSGSPARAAWLGSCLGRAAPPKGLHPLRMGGSGERQRSPFTERISLFSTPKWGCCQTDCCPFCGSLPPRLLLRPRAALPLWKRQPAGGFTCNSFYAQRRELKTKSGFFFLLLACCE